MRSKMLAQSILQGQGHQFRLAPRCVAPILLTVALQVYVCYLIFDILFTSRKALSWELVVSIVRVTRHDADYLPLSYDRYFGE